MKADKDLSRKLFQATFSVGVALILLLSLVLGASAGQVGKVIALQGKVELKREKEADFHQARLSEDVYERDLVKTGPGSRVKIFLGDDSLLFLAENSQIQVKEFAYKPAQRFRRALVKAFGGKMRFLVSKLMSPQNSRFEVETTTAVMGIRGTDGIAVMKSPTQAICLTGEIYVHGLGLTKEVLLTPNLMTMVEAGRDPIPPYRMATEYLQQLLGEFRIRPSLSGGAEGGPPSGGLSVSGGGPGGGGGGGVMTGTVEAWSITVSPGGRFPGGSGGMTETPQAWPIGIGGPGFMTDTPGAWGPPLLLEPPAGMEPPPAQHHPHTHPGGPINPPEGPPYE